MQTFFFPEYPCIKEEYVCVFLRGHNGSIKKKLPPHPPAHAGKIKIPGARITQEVDAIAPFRQVDSSNV